MQKVLKDSKLNNALHRYRTTYLNKHLENLDESATRIIINHLLSDVLGYRELIDIKTEFPIMGGYIDYLIILNNRKSIVIEAKSIRTQLSNKHLRQAIYYGATVGADWIILTNARSLELYKIKYTKPLNIKKIFSIDFKKNNSNTGYLTSYLTKKSVNRGDLEYFAKKHDEIITI